MKHIILLLATLALSSGAFTQVFYESPYVIEGSSYQFTVPPGYENVETGSTEFQMFSTNPDIMLEMEGETINSDFIMIGITENEGEEMDNIFDELVEEYQTAENTSIKVSSFQTPSNKEFQTLNGKIGFITEQPTQTMMAITEFQDVLVIVLIVDGDNGNDIDPSLLEALLSSYKEVETDRESTFMPYEEPMNESEPRFVNDQFPTDLSYDYINLFPEITWETENAERYWEEDWRKDYPELLLAFFLTEIEGADAYAGIKIFSGGYEDYTSGVKKLLALQKVFPSHNIGGLTNEETMVEGEMFSFQKYSVQSDASEFKKQTLYITEIAGETVFVLGYFTETPTEELEKELEEVVITLDYDD